MRDNLDNIKNLLPEFNVKYFDEIDSTNNYAKNLIRENNNLNNLSRNKILIIADKQTAGRGRTGHSFISPSGTGVYLTLIIEPVKNFQLVTIAAAVSVCLALEKFIDLNNKAAKIKWVNDIFICDKLTRSSKKVCGILAEAVNGRDNKISKIIVGIGVNIWPYKFEDLNLSRAGSVFDEVNNNNNKITRAEIAAEIVKNLAGFAEDLDSPEVIDNYKSRIIFNTSFHSGNISYIYNNQKFFGRVIDIDKTGGLVIKDFNNNLITLRSGEVFEIRESDSN
ncbi:MAG: biotin--[Synergistaceae bacterium]|nr:biotin--[acetyl-CoA-carboxylase] ligase [Synergistaceae bacterium]MBR0222373.1 biotin--[acetyl-CoA-carboxylase] ligase [Synergistaceae bacterium]